MRRRSGRKGNWVPQDADDWVPRRHERAEEIRRAVLEAAVKLLGEVGPRRFTVKEVAWRARVGRTSVYKYFGIKAELLAACRAYMAQRWGRGILWSKGAAAQRADRWVQERGRRLRPGLEAVRQAILAVAEHAGVATDMFLLAAGEGVRSKRRPRTRYPAFMARETCLPPLPQKYLGTVAELVRQAADRGELRAGLEPQAVAGWLAALWWYDLCVRGPRGDGARGTVGGSGGSGSGNGGSGSGSGGLADGRSDRMGALSADLERLLAVLSAA